MIYWCFLNKNSKLIEKLTNKHKILVNVIYLKAEGAVAMKEAWTEEISELSKLYFCSTIYLTKVKKNSYGTIIVKQDRWLYW